MAEPENAHDAGEGSRKARKSRYQDDSMDGNVTRRVLAPFLARHRKKLKSRLADVKAEYLQVYQQTRPSEVLAKLAAYLQDSLQLNTVLNETSEIMKAFTASDGVSLYTVDPGSEYIVLNQKYLPKSDRHIVRYPIEPGTTVAAYVAYTQEFVVEEDLLGDPRFPEGVPGAGKAVKAVLCVPVFSCSEGKVLAVIELYRTVFGSPYSLVEVEAAVAMSGWMGAAINQNNEKLFLVKKVELTKYLMNLLQFLFSAVIPFDRFVSDLVIFAKASIGAERGLFYGMVEPVAEGTDEDILTEVYEEGLDDNPQTYKKKLIQSFPKNGPGIAGHVARTGRTILLADAYRDERFNKASDAGGFRSRTILAVPVKSSLHVFGVLQLVNKLPNFTDEDEELLQIFASFALLACQYEKAAEDLRKTLRRYEGNCELLGIHLRPCPDDVDLLAATPRDAPLPKGYFGFDWFLGDRERSAVQYVIASFTHCLGPDLFDPSALSEFVLMAKKSYRPNPYHNFVHAFTVFHCVFNIINKNRQRFTVIEKIALLIGTLCHDADHFGFTNSFLGMTNNWLANLYEESSLEHHHFDVCMMLIEITDLFSKQTAEEFREIVLLIESLILATDLAAHFKIRGTVAGTVKSGAFDWSNREHRLMLLHVIMTCCDISGQCKPFSVAKCMTECLYREFYRQGDEEKKRGVTPLAMMDRNQRGSIPTDQIQFLTIICVPCLEILAAVLPNTEILLKMCLNVRESWRIIKSQQSEKLWWPEEALSLDGKFASFRSDFGIRSATAAGRRKHRGKGQILHRMDL